MGKGEVVDFTWASIHQSTWIVHCSLSSIFLDWKAVVG